VRAINAVSETAAEKPVFRDSMRKRRCLIPAHGFYEWQRVGPKSKQPYNIGLADDGLFAFAGLWDRWKDPTDSAIESSTTEPNALVRDVHDRIPVILKKEDYDLWLDPGVTDPAKVADVLKPFDARLMRKYPVSTLVNKVENDGPECVQEIEIGTCSTQSNLFTTE